MVPVVRTEVAPCVFYVPAMLCCVPCLPCAGPQQPSPCVSETDGTPCSESFAADSRHPSDGSQASDPRERPTGANIPGRVLLLSRDAEGCRQVQKALRQAQDDDTRLAIAMELRGHVAEMACCQHGNYVLQMLIQQLRPMALQFIVDEVMAGHTIFRVMRHKCGCRVVQRLLEHCTERQSQHMTEAILSDVYWLACHPYGNFVVQQLLERGSPAQQLRITQVVQWNIQGLARDMYGRYLVNACILSGPEECKPALAAAIAQEPCLMECLARATKGRLAVRHVQQMSRRARAGGSKGRRAWASGTTRRGIRRP